MDVEVLALRELTMPHAVTSALERKSNPPSEASTYSAFAGASAPLPACSESKRKSYEDISIRESRHHVHLPIHRASPALLDKQRTFKSILRRISKSSIARSKPEWSGVCTLAIKLMEIEDASSENCIYTVNVFKLLTLSTGNGENRWVYAQILELRKLSKLWPDNVVHEFGKLFFLSANIFITSTYVSSQINA